MNDPKPDDQNPYRFSLWRALASQVCTILSLYFSLAAYANCGDSWEMVFVCLFLAIVFFTAAVGVLYRQAIEFVLLAVLRIIAACFGL